MIIVLGPGTARGTAAGPETVIMVPDAAARPGPTITAPEAARQGEHGSMATSTTHDQRFGPPNRTGPGCGSRTDDHHDRGPPRGMRNGPHARPTAHHQWLGLGDGTGDASPPGGVRRDGYADVVRALPSPGYCP